MITQGRRSIGSRERVSRPAPSIATSGTDTINIKLVQGTSSGYGVGAGHSPARLGRSACTTGS